MTYDPRNVRLAKLSGATMVGWTWRLGTSRIGQTKDTHTDVAVSAIDMTDGYEIGSNGELSLDPMTGSASMSERFNPNVSDKVISKLDTPLAPDDRIEVSYGNAVVHQGAILSVDIRMEAVGAYWIRKTTYQFSGPSGIMLQNTVSWVSLPEESSLARLRRWFMVSTSLLTPAQVAYLDGVLMPAIAEAGTATYLDVAREFSAATLFPLRNMSILPERWREISVIPAVTFQGTQPTADITDAERWSSGADFTQAVGVIRKATTVDVIKNFDEFIAGVTTVSSGGAPLGSFQLATHRLGKSFTQPIGIQVPAVVDAFGTILVTSKVSHAFTSRDYHSALELVEPVKVG